MQEFIDHGLGWLYELISILGVGICGIIAICYIIYVKI